MAKEIIKKAGVSGNSVAGKSFQIFTVSEELLAKVVEAVQAGEKEARSSGNIQSFEVFCHGFRANIALGRIMVIPAKVCNDRQNFPTALLHGALVRVFGTGGEEIADLIEKKIGDSEFDEYSQADFDTIKEELFTDVKTGEETSLIVFAPNWMNSREYICFHFSDNEEQLKNDLRHQVFSAYYNPSVSSAFNALMTNVDTTKVDVTDITPKLSYPFLTENPLKQFPQLEKSAGHKKATILLNRKTADEITKQTLDPQELDVFDSLNQALENSLLPDADGAQGEAGFKAPEAHPGVPREASAKVAHIDANGICPGCKKAGSECSCQGCTCSKQAEEQGNQKSRDERVNEYLRDMAARGFTPEPATVERLKKGTLNKVAYVAHVPGHKNSKGEAAPWVIKQHDTDKILESFKSEAAAKAGLRNMESHKGSKEACAPFETPFTNVGPGSAAHDEQEASAPAMKETVGEDNPEHRAIDGDPIGIAIDENGVPRSKAEEEKKAGKKAAPANNPNTNRRDFAHPETQRVDPNRLSSAYSAAYNGGFVDKHAMPPKEVRSYLNDKMGNNDEYAPHAAADHQKDIAAGKYGDDPLTRRSNEKWGSAEIPSKVKRSNKEVLANYIADVVAAEIDEPSEAISTKAAAARAKKESLLDKFRPKTAVELDIDSIWDAITEDMGPAPLVEVDNDPSNPAPSNTEGESQSTPGNAEEEPRSGARPNKRDVQDLPEEFRSPEPEDEKSLSDSEADSQEDSTPHADSDTKQSSWRIDSKFADFVEDVAGEIESEEELPRMGCDQCQMMSINGHAVHEEGCPNDGARWDSENGMWIPQRECSECGEEVDYDNPCCSAPVMDEAEEARWASADKTADTADNEYDIDAAADPTSKETGPSDTVECHQDYNTEQSEGTDRPKPEAGADIKQAGGVKRLYEDEMINREQMLNSIQNGDRVTILVPAGMGRGGQEWTERSGRAVMRSAEGGWVLNMGGRDGTPGLVNERNIVKVHKRKQADGDTVKCPKCGSANVSYDADPNTWACHSCDAKFGDGRKQADTADNPYNMTNDGKGAPENKKVVDVKDTTGPTPDNTKKAQNQNKGVKQMIGEKHDHGVEGDVAQAKSETTSPDVVDADISQPTVSVLDAGKRKNSGEDKTAAWMNEYEIDRAVQDYVDNPHAAARFPVRAKAAQFLREFRDEVNSHSDGWAYWKLPANAAKQLMDLLQASHQEPEILTEQAFRKALGPIKSFMTRRGTQAGMQMPKLGADISGDMSEAKAELTYNKAEIADDPQATQTVSVEDAGERKNSADISGDIAEADAAIDYDKAVIADDTEAENTVNPEHFADKKACGEDQPESVEFDFGAGDLADIVLVEEHEEE